jgi:8-oxo-dGTP pyrophosphatase MutT (NUDIX family)
MQKMRKVVVYATHHRRLLVFTQPDFPDAGLQVPGGTVETGEHLEEAAAREFHEETGLVAPAKLTFLGQRDHVYRALREPQLHQRAFFHLSLPRAPLPETWEHLEATPHAASTVTGAEPIRFAFRWQALDEDFTLVGELDALLDVVRDRVLGNRPAGGKGARA